MNIKVSVIIPVYNAETYLAECIESLLCQTIKECEFIFINDGSKDNSMGIIEKYKDKDSRIILINQENQGVSIARNKGLDIAAGEYVGFVDADDYVEKDMYKTLYTTVKENNCDVIFSNFNSGTNRNEVLIHYPFVKGRVLNSAYIKNEILPYFLMKENLNSACNKVYNLKLIKENNIKFPEKIPIGEDGMFNLHFFSLTKRAFYLDYTGYIYREVEGSATRNFIKQDYFKRALEIYLMELPEMIKGSLDDLILQQFKSIKLIESVRAQMFLASSSNISFIKKYRYIKNIITNKYVREALSVCSGEQFNGLGRYERYIFKMMKSRFVLGIYFANLYSQLRNNY